MKDPDIVIVGAGLFGITVAQQAAEKGYRSLIIEKRNHIGGNAYSYFDKETGIEIHKYGAHIFHTRIEKVWDYVTRFTDFTKYEHHVYSLHNGEVYPLPINLGTINQFFHAHYTPDEARALLREQAGKYADVEPTNLIEQGIKLIGEPLFNAFIRDYTTKQWQIPAEDIPAVVVRRLPVRFTYNNSYFRDPHQGLPVNGYTAWFQRMLTSDLIDVRLNTDFFDMSQPLSRDFLRGTVPILYTGSVDHYFDYRFGPLTWKTVDFTEERYDEENHLGCAVLNYPDLDIPYTRSIEFKNFNPEREAIWHEKKTIVWSETSRFADERQGDEPFYPVHAPKDDELYAKYYALEKDEPDVIFGGRLGSYAYFNMDQTINAALERWEDTIQPLLLARRTEK